MIGATSRAVKPGEASRAGPRHRCYRAAVLVRWVAIAALVAPAWFGAAASASPAEEAFDGAVFAGPTGAHTGSIIANPASLLRLIPGWHLFLNGAARLEQISVARDVVSADGASAPGATARGRTFGAGGQVGAILAWPGGMIAATTALAPPEETLTGEAALAYHSLGTRSRRVDWFSLAGGYRYGRAIHLAFSATLSERRTTLQFARDTALDAGRDPDRGVTSDCGGVACGLEHPAATELWTLRVAPDYLLDINNLILSAGLLVRLPSATLLGLSYQRPWSLGSFELSGTARIDAAPRDGGGVASGEATVFVELPEVWRLGTRTAVAPEWEIVTEVRWRRLANVGTFDVRTHGGDLEAGRVPEYFPRARGLRDAVAVELGLEQIDVGQPLIVGGRFGVDTGATGGHRISPTSPWGPEMTAAIGGQLRVGSQWIVQAGYQLGYQLPVDADPSAFDPIDRLDCVDRGHDFDLPACATVRAGYGLPSAAGTYRRWDHVAWLALRVEVR